MKSTSNSTKPVTDRKVCAPTGDTTEAAVQAKQAEGFRRKQAIEIVLHGSKSGKKPK